VLEGWTKHKLSILVNEVLQQLQHEPLSTMREQVFSKTLHLV